MPLPCLPCPAMPACRWPVLLALPLTLGLAGQVLATEAPASAVFAGGCFWCVEGAFDQAEGVLSTTSGFSGGNVEDPSYNQVVSGGTGHAEVVKVEYDPAVVD